MIHQPIPVIDLYVTYGRDGRCQAASIFRTTKQIGSRQSLDMTVSKKPRGLKEITVFSQIHICHGRRLGRRRSHKRLTSSGLGYCRAFVLNRKILIRGFIQ